METKLSDKEVLQKAIEIAIENGMKIVHYRKSFVFSDEIGQNPNYEEYENRVDLSIVFSHDFAKAFFEEHAEYEPEDLVKFHKHYGYLPMVETGWQHHLQQMVLCDNPIDYLRKFIDNTETKK